LVEIAVKVKEQAREEEVVLKPKMGYQAKVVK